MKRKPTLDDKIIKVEIVQNDIETRVTLEEFKQMMLKEIGSVTFTITQSQFNQKVTTAIDRVIQSIRDNR